MAPPGKIEALGTGYQFRAAATLAQMRSARFILRLSAGRLAGFWLGGSRLFSWPVHDMVRIIGKLGLSFRHPDTPLHGNPRLMHACRRS